MFDPKNPDYKKHSDLPEAMKGDYAEDGEGFVRKSAKDEYLGAEKEAYENYKIGEMKNTKPLEVLNNRVDKSDEEKKEFKQLVEITKKLFKGERDETWDTNNVFNRMISIVKAGNFNNEDLFEVMPVYFDVVIYAPDEFFNNKEIVLKCLNMPDLTNIDRELFSSRLSESLKRDGDVKKMIENS